VYGHLAEKFGEEYGLIFVFTVRTAVELHRAWHMTLLTSKILQQIKDKFQMRMTWNLGVIRLKFRVEDGGFELHRKVPYDYDSEFQDLYVKIAVALIEGHITIHEALIFQAETKLGRHTASSGLFLRENPGRLILYPLEAATCTVIFFGGDWRDAGVAAVCGVSAGLVEYGLGYTGGEAKVLVDVLVGIATGIVGGLFQRFNGQNYCLSSIFLGTLYWFFYGTAFVIGLLEIIAGELETGVTRFIAVSVKTFVLTLGSCIGLQIVLSGSVYTTWVDQDENCGTVDLGSKWWRIPLYLLCSASALGQYRVPIVHYWRGLVVQLVGYEVQYQMFEYLASRHNRDFLDTAASNITGAMAAVLTACTLSYLVDQLGYYYNARILQRDTGKFSPFGEFMYRFARWYVRFTNMVGLGRKSSLQLVKMEKTLKESTAELRDPNHPRREIVLQPQEEAVLVEAIIEAEGLNIWAILMPAVYQLVPGSLIAKLWYNAVFPPPQLETEMIDPRTGFVFVDVANNPLADDVFYGLWVISTSLALGLILGFAIVQVLSRVLAAICSLFTCCVRKDQSENEEKREKQRIKRMRFRRQGVMVDTTLQQEDPDGQDPVLIREGARHGSIGHERLERIQKLMEQEDALDPNALDNNTGLMLSMEGTEERANSSPDLSPDI